MQIALKDTGEFDLKLKDTSIRLGDSVTIGDYALPGPGEYEVAGVMAEASATTTHLYAEDLTIGYLAKRSKKLTDQELEELGAIDILFFPIGSDALATKEAVELLAQVEAPIMIPIAQDPEALTEFCAARSGCEEQVGPLKLTRSGLPLEGFRVIYFS